MSREHEKPGSLYGYHLSLPLRAPRHSSAALMSEADSHEFRTYTHLNADPASDGLGSAC